MNGMALESRPKFPIGALLLLAIAVAATGVSLATKNSDCAIFSILPACIGTALLLTTPKSFQAVLTDSELLLLHSCETIPYSQINRLWYANAGQPAASIYVIHEAGVLRIPRCNGTESDDLYEILKTKLPKQDVPQVNSALTGFLQSQAGTFGIDRVWVYNARPKIAEQTSFRAPAVFIMAIIVSFVWIMIGVSKEKVDWTGVGSILLVVSIFAFLIWALRNQRSPKQFGVKNWHQSSLVISPLGLGLVQGELIGQLRWSELQGVKLNNGKTPRYRRIDLRVEGAQILLRDLYEAPLTEIHRRIEDYWQAG